MLSDLFSYIKGGASVMRSNTKVLLVGTLVFVFPLVFFYVTQSFLATATNNIETVQKQKVELINQSISTILESDSLSNRETLISYLKKIVENSLEVKDISIVEKTLDQLLVIASTDDGLVYGSEVDIGFYESLVANNDSAIIVKSETGSGRIWESYQMLIFDEKTYYIYIQQDFSILDQVLFSRVQQSYLGLSLIFIFLMGLAYWLNRQTFWQKKYDDMEVKLSERDRFSHMIAHEFRTPLTAIKGYASFLKESENVTGEDVRFVANISQSTERLIHLVNDFLEVAKLQSGTVTITKEKVSLAELFEVVLIDMEPLALASNIRLSSDVPPNLFLNTDKSRLQQILVNLVNNSIKYSNEGTVKLTAGGDNEELNIWIEDSGLGISGKDQKKLFKPFSRVGEYTKQEIVGTGLGMWITNQLVTLLGGEISLESISGIGTKITLSFEVNDDK